MANVACDLVEMHNELKLHTASTVLMVPPVHFKFNAETSADNEFQHTTSLSDAQVRKQALEEFNAMVASLRSNGVEVIEMNYPESDVETPDAVFPNNWFSTTSEGDLFFFPMACPNRRNEVRSELIQSYFQQSGKQVQQVRTLADANDGAFLESTGVMIMDHRNDTIYAALSTRCDRELLEEYAEINNVSRVISFQTTLPSGSPIYHTNVMMAIGESFCVVCDEIIPEFERRYVLKQLGRTKEIVSISLDQMNQFCGNVLQIQNDKGEKLIAMSLSAFNAFTDDQKEVLSRHGKLLPFDVSTIETIGGGSVRCMLGEVFLPNK